MRTTRVLRLRSSGFTAIELTFSVSIFVVILLASLSMMERDTRLSQATLGIGTAEQLAQQMLFELEHELANARGERPIATVAVPLNAGETGTLQVSSTLGFPPEGILLVDRENGSVERIAYEGLGANQTTFLKLTRGEQCTQDTSHSFQASVLWGGLAEPIAEQTNPLGFMYDGLSQELQTQTYFRGDGTGFSYRVPVDPTDQMNGKNFMDGDDLFWGGVIDEVVDPRDAWICVYFEPKTTVSEEATGDDINRDGDRDDVFDIGQLRRRVWSAVDPDVEPTDLGLGPSAVMQEQCNWGSDLTGDGLDDPIFLWNKDRRQLHVRLMVIGTTVNDIPITRVVESVVFLRNHPQS